MNNFSTRNSQLAASPTLSRLYELSASLGAFTLRFIWAGLVFLLWFANAYPRLILPDAARPFVYRVLVPMVARTLAGIAPVFTPGALPILDQLAVQLSPDPAYYLEACWTVLIMFAALLAAWSGIERLLQNLGARPVMRSLLPAVLIGGVIFFAPYGYIYDLPQLALITWCLALLIVKDYEHRFPAVFALACLNKETAILLVLATAAYTWPLLTRHEWVKINGSMVAIYGAVRLFTMLLFAGNPGGVVEWHWKDWLTSFQHDPLLLVMWLVCLGAIAALVLLGWKHKPRLLRCALLPLVPMTVMFFVWAWPWEVRTYLEYWPVIGLMALPWSTAGSAINNETGYTGRNRHNRQLDIASSQPASVDRASSDQTMGAGEYRQNQRGERS